MCYFCITFEDGRLVEVEQVTSVTYNQCGFQTNVPEAELSSHCFPTGTSLWLHTKSGTFSVDGNKIRLIEVREE